MNVNELRALVRKRQQAANAKARRLEAKGVSVSGTKYDPRRDPAKIRSYNSRQLNSYLNELNAFTDRGNQFVGLADGSIVPSKKWRTYKGLERRYNAVGKREYSRVKDLKLPNAGRTVAERDADIMPNRKRVRRAAGEANSRLYEPVNLRPQNVNGVKALETLIRHRRKQLSRAYKPDQIKRQRKEMNAMLKEIGESQLIEGANSLTDEQFNVLWNYGSFATDLSRDYERKRLLNEGGSSAEQDKVVEDARSDIVDALQWAAALRFRKAKK